MRCAMSAVRCVARASLLAVVCLVGTNRPSPADEAGLTTIFDGRSLTGWTQRNGTAAYEVVDGSIVGTTADGSPNSFLCSDTNYGDFELVFETKVHDALNAGVQIRSQTAGGPKGRVNGPQVEIEATKPKGAFAGYVYGEAAGGWMTPDAARKPHKHFKNGEWNSYRVLATGPRIQTWINGEKIGDVVHEERYKTHPNGFIGLQVHGIPRGKGPYTVAYRSIKVREVNADEAATIAAAAPPEAVATPAPPKPTRPKPAAPPAAPAPAAPAAAAPARAEGFVDLYNGKDLTGWETTRNWLPQPDGSLLLQQRPGEKGYSRFDAYLWTKAKYKDFILDLEYSYPPGGNSGVYFRVADRKNPVATGIEAQILDCSKKPEGAPMTHHDHGGIVRTVGATKNMSKAPGEWNRMVVTCRGPHVEVELNGEKIIDTKVDKGPMKHCPPEGYIGLQDHGEPHALRFRNIRIKPL